MRRYTVSLALLLLLFAGTGVREMFSFPESRTYQNTERNSVVGVLNLPYDFG